jgi:hypothetical protein
MYIPCIFIVYYLFVLTNAHTHTHIYIYIYIYIYIKIRNYITHAPKCFGASAPPSGSCDIAFAKIIKY